MSRFFAYGELAAISPHVSYARSRSWRESDVVKSMGVLLRFTDGRTAYLVCSAKDIRDLTAHVNERRLAHERGAPAELHILRRGDRSMADWVAYLRGLLEGKGYRGSAPTPDALWSVLEDPKSEAEARAAAALALRAHLRDEATPRLRVAIEACASPRLRVALESIDHEDEAATGAALKRLSR
jgi:hypothetical protein